MLFIPLVCVLNKHLFTKTINNWVFSLSNLISSSPPGYEWLEFGHRGERSLATMRKPRLELSPTLSTTPILRTKQLPYPHRNMSQDSVVSQASLTGLLTVKANEYVTGTKLMIIIAGVSLAVFLMLVGTMIISTV